MEFALAMVLTVVNAVEKIELATRVENVAAVLVPVDAPSVENARDVGTHPPAPPEVAVAIIMWIKNV